MATRLYPYGQHTDVESPVTPSSWSAGWNAGTGGSEARPLLVAKAQVDLAYLLQTNASGTSGHFTAVRRFVSEPLAAQTISGTIKGHIRCSETNATDNFTLAIAVKVIQPGGSDRGVLLAVSASDDTSATPPEMATTLTNRAFRNSAESASISLSSLAVSLGDRLVVEIGFRQASTSTALGSISVSAGAASDLAEDDTTTAANNSWIEFSQDIEFAVAYFGSASTPADGAAATGTADPTAVTPPTGMVAGDLVCMIGQQRAAGATLAVSEAGGQSWTSETAITTTNQTARLFWCVFDGTWDANPSVDFSAAVCNSVQMHVFRTGGADWTWSVNQAQVELDIAAAATQTITGQTTTGTDPTVTLAGWFTADDNTWNTLAGTGWQNTGSISETTNNTSQYRNTSGSDQSATYAHKIQTSAGATGNVSKNQFTNGNDAATSFIITFAAAAPAGGASLSPSSANLALSTTAPTVSISDNKDISPASRDLALSSTAPSSVIDERRDPGQGNLALSTTAPTVEQTTHTSLSPATANLVLSTVAPTVEQTAHVSLSPATANLTLSAVAPSMVVDVRMGPASGNLTLSTVAPSLVVDVRRDPASANLALSTTAPSVAVDFRFEPAAGNLTLSTVAPSVSVGFEFAPATGNLALSTQAPTVSVTDNRDATPATANLVLTGFAPTVSVGFEFVPATGNLTLSGFAPSVVATDNKDISPASANLTLSSVAPAVVQDTRRDPAAGQLSLSTVAPTVDAGAGVSFSPASANLVLSSTAPTVQVSGGVSRARPVLHAIEGGLAAANAMQSGLHPIEFGVAA